jgi:TolB-like protein
MKPARQARVARRLAASYVLEGSVRKAGNWVRITGQLSTRP